MSETTNSMDYVAIEKAIPHRPPFLLIDRVEDIVTSERATGIKAVSGGEPYFAGHFPGNPVMPGVLIIEAMAQTASCLVAHSFPEDTDGKLVFFTTIDKTRFKRPVRPGDMLKLHVEKIATTATLWKFSGKAEVDGKVVTQAEFSAMIVPANA